MHLQYSSGELWRNHLQKRVCEDSFDLLLLACDNNISRLSSKLSNNIERVCTDKLVSSFFDYLLLQKVCWPVERMIEIGTVKKIFEY